MVKMILNCCELYVIIKNSDIYFLNEERNYIAQWKKYFRKTKEIIIKSNLIILDWFYDT